jgi:hypothetical protein
MLWLLILFIGFSKTLLLKGGLTGLVFVLIISLELYCSPFEGFGFDSATGWYYPCGALSQKMKELYLRSDSLTLSNLFGLILRLSVSFLISYGIVGIYRLVSRIFPRS